MSDDCNRQGSHEEVAKRQAADSEKLGPPPSHMIEDSVAAEVSSSTPSKALHHLSDAASSDGEATGAVTPSSLTAPQSEDGGLGGAAVSAASWLAPPSENSSPAYNSGGANAENPFSTVHLRRKKLGQRHSHTGTSTNKTSSSVDGPSASKRSGFVDNGGLVKSARSTRDLIAASNASSGGGSSESCGGGCGGSGGSGGDRLRLPNTLGVSSAYGRRRSFIHQAAVSVTFIFGGGVYLCGAQ